MPPAYPSRLLCLLPALQKQSARVLLVGTQAGEVRCYDTARAELRWAVAGAVDGAVAGLSCAPDDAATVLAIGRTGGAAVLDLSTGAVGRKFQVGHRGREGVLGRHGGLLTHNPWSAVAC